MDRLCLKYWIELTVWCLRTIDRDKIKNQVADRDQYECVFISCPLKAMYCPEEVVKSPQDKKYYYKPTKSEIVLSWT